MELRQLATAYIFKEEKLLMIKKSKSRLYNNEFWSGLGGHLEPDELNDPKTACYREILEESGIKESELLDLKLRYILIRIKENEIRQQYVYIGETLKNQIVASYEGELEWLAIHEVLAKHISRINRGMLEHYLVHRDSECIYVGVITMGEKQEPVMQWSELRDPMIF